MLVTRLFWTAYFAAQTRGQARLPFQSPGYIQRVQAWRVRRMVAHAYRTVPYYRETMRRLGLTPDDFRTADDLAKLPLLERDTLQRDLNYLTSTARPRDQYLLVRSGGSGAAPRGVYYDTAALFQNAAHGERERSIFSWVLGTSFGYRELTIISPISTASRVQRHCRERSFVPRGVRRERAYASLLDPPARMVEIINDFKPDVVHTYGSYLVMLFAHVRDTGVRMHMPRLLTYSSDVLPEGGRRLIAEGFGIPVFSTYQAAEAFKIGFECEQHRGLHLNIDLFPIRVVDDEARSLPAGESGDIVVSNLVNRGTVLLNYRLGDISALLPEACACGRNLPLLAFPQGRDDDLIELPSGEVLHPQAVRTMFLDENGIWQYQVAQVAPTHFRIAILASVACDRAATRASLEAKFTRMAGQPTTLEIEFVESIERTPGGKFRPVMSLRQQARREQALTGEER